MIIGWSERGWDQYLSWQIEDRNVLRRINRLVEAIRRDPFVGEGKPEPLGGDLAGFWSRRITDGHRLVYQVRGKGTDRVLLIAQCKYHY